MISNDTPDREMERTLEGYFEAESARLRAPAGLWERIEGMLEDRSDPEGNTPAWQRIFSPRRWGLVPAFATTMVLLLAVSGTWLFTAAPWQDGEDGAPGWLQPQGTDSPAPAPASQPTPAPAPTGTPAPRAAAVADDFRLENVELAGPAGPAGPQGPQGATGATGAPGPAGAPGALSLHIARDAGGYVPGALDTAQRQVISQASVSVEVDEVPAAVAQVRAIAESLGGFVGQLSSSGGPERQQSTMTIRVPQAEFFTALEHIKSLGKVRGENVGSEDVTERFIDLEARLRSALREEESLLSLLERANQVSEILAIERELARIRSDIERYQGQLSFLERRVDLSTITVSLFPPDVEVAEPPSGSLTVEVSDVSRSVEEIKALVSRVGGELDRIFVAVRDGKESAEMTLRVSSRDFEQVLSSVEAHGKVRSKTVRETTPPAEGEATPSVRPDARIVLSFVEKESSDVGRTIAIAAPVGGAALAVLLGLLLYVTYRAGRRRSSPA